MSNLAVIINSKMFIPARDRAEAPPLRWTGGPASKMGMTQDYITFEMS